MTLDLRVPPPQSPPEKKTHAEELGLAR